MSRLAALAGCVFAALLTTATPSGGAERTPDELVREVAARSAWWLAPPPQLESLEYDFVSGADVAPIRAKKEERLRYGVWIGTTLHAGFRDLMKTPQRYDVTAEPAADGKTITLRATLKAADDNIGVEAGNGVDGSWRGYYSHGARETTVVLDAERLVPLEERTGLTTVRYSGWRQVADGKWVPGQADVLGNRVHWRMRFAWLGNAAWLLTSTESIGPEGNAVAARTRNVRVNGEAAEVPESEAETGSREAAAVLRAMLDANRSWLDGGETGAGFRPPFETLSYSFHTEREDVREACVLGRDGGAAFEVTHDGQLKMKEGFGRRKVSLGGGEYATSVRGARFARISGRPERQRGLPADLALKHYARIGCQFDLPLFRYRERLDAATVSVADGEWNGTPCRVATVSDLGGDLRLGCGTMLAFTSWSYVHHVAPSKEVIYVDPTRNVPVHETLVDSRGGRTWEIDFADYVEVEPGQRAPLSIRVEAKDYFTCEYRFQFVAGRHWMLKEVTSWFKPEEKSRGVVEEVRVDAGRELLDETLRQVEATRTLETDVGRAAQAVDVAAVPFVIGEVIQAGPYEVRVTYPGPWSVVVSVSTKDPNASGRVPLVFLDGERRPVFSPAVVLEEKDGVRKGSVTLNDSWTWADVRFVATPGPARGATAGAVKVFPLRWGETVSVNVPDAIEGDGRKSRWGTGPAEAKTWVYQARVEKDSGGAAKAVLDLVSFDGPREFLIDVPVALLDGSGRLLAAGHHSGSLLVEDKAVETKVEVDLGRVAGGSKPTLLAIGVSPGNVTRAPSGSVWATFFHDTPPFEIGTLLNAADDDCRRAGLAALGQKEVNESIRKEFFDERATDERRVGDGTLSRRTLLRPHADVLVRIVKESASPDVKAAAGRLLAYSEDPRAAEALEGLLSAESPARDAAEAGLTFLGSVAHLDRLRERLAGGEFEPERGGPLRRTFARFDEDRLIALARQGSDAAVDLLGETMAADLRVPPGETQGELNEAGRRSERAKQISHVLRRSGNPRAVRWLTEAWDSAAADPVVGKRLDRSAVARSLVRFREAAEEQVTAELASGPNAFYFAQVLREERDSTFLPAVREMFRRSDVDERTRSYGIEYLWNVGTAEAVEGLREAHERGAEDRKTAEWLLLCRALAAKGDGRGLADAYAVLVDLERPAEPPKEEKQRRSWDGERDDRRREAAEVFARAPKEVVAAFLADKAGVTGPEEKRVVLARLWELPEVPPAFAAVLPGWAADPDAAVARSAARLLDRDSKAE